jgi:uncharacterized phage protein gp47/JayE
MPLAFEKSFDSLQAEVIETLTSETNITNVTPGSTAKAIVTTFNRKLNKAYQDFDINFLRSFLPFAQGRFLDYIGDMLGVSRLGSTNAFAPTEAKLVKFYVASGTFGNLNGDQDIFVPAGTQISTLPNNEGIVYRLSNAVFLTAALSEQFVPVVAVRDGSGANLGPDSLRFTTFTNYGASTGLLVTNVGIINTGSDIENDTNYRFRISNQVLAAEKANETAVRLALLVVPGVSDVILRKYARGIGTFDYIIQTVVPNTPTPIIDACQEAIARVQAEGINGRALAPRLTGMSFQISITWRSDATTEDRNSIKRNIAVAIQDYVNNLAVGEEFIYNELIQRVMDVDNKIKNVGTADQAIDLIFIHRLSKLRDNAVKEELVGDYTPSADERLIVEPSLETPVVLIDKN